MEIQKIADEKLDRLADDPDNIVYRYTDQAVPDVVMPLMEVKDHIVQLWALFKDTVKGRELTYAQIRQLRRNICRKYPKWNKFSASHPLVFDRVVDHRTDEPEIRALLYMIFLKDMQNKGDIQDGAQQLQSYIFDTFATTEAEYRAQNKDQDVNIIDPSRQPPPA